MSANPTMQESFAELFEESLGRQEMRPGEVITAEVVRIDQNFRGRQCRTEIRELHRT
jgi:small subunit ribosomal protein S1